MELLEKILTLIINHEQVIRRISRLVLAGLLVFTFVFTLYSHHSLSSRIARLEEKLDSLSSDISSVSKFKEDNEKVVSQLESFDELKMKILTNIAIANLKLDQYSKAVFNASDSGKGFARVDSAAGMFFLVLDKVEQVSDGYKLYFRLGNPQTCVYNGFTAKLRWGKKYDDQDKSITKEDWEKSLKSSDMSFQNKLMPGQWTSFEISISPAQPEDIEYIEVKIQAEQISLQRAS